LQLPERIENEPHLEEVLSQPSDADVEALGNLGGDLLILGAGGKMGPSLARRARRAAERGGIPIRIVAASRFSEPGVESGLRAAGIDTLIVDLLERDQLARLPEVRNIVFMAGRKFGSTGAEALTWGMNAYLPALVAERFRESRIVAFSSGNVYPLVPIVSGGSTEGSPVGPVGEYAASVLARERLLEYMSLRHGTTVVLLRLNYAIELRYGVLLDIGTAVHAQRPIDLSMGTVNLIWQGDANSVCLRSFPLCQSPPAILNLTGPETLSVRRIARRFGELLDVDPVFAGTESQTALLSNAGRSQELFGYPSVPVGRIIEWTAHWIKTGGPTLHKPTHFETRDGQF
jgi:nucleoside-diphosphate-sugar epimerase